MMDKENMKTNMLSDDALDEVSGGVERMGYTDSQLKKAGITVSSKNGQRVYETKLSNGQSVVLSKNAAFSAVDCYNISGGVKLSDDQLQDLIKQS